jgi:thioesterase domain-containing protein/acyl carrier protein
MTDLSKSLSNGRQSTFAEESVDGFDLDRNELAKHVDVSTPQFSGATASMQDISGVLVGWWKELLALESVSLDDDFLDLGGDSLLGTQLFNRIEKTYGLELRLSTLFEARTVRQLAQLILQSSQPTHLEPRPLSPIVPMQSQGSRSPLYLIPGGYGTTVLPFREVSLLLGSDQPVYGFEANMPAHDEELESIPERAARFTQELRAVQPKGPYSLIGWCGGGYIAFEMAQQLSREGEVVAFLAIVECAVPRYPTSVVGRVRLKAEWMTWRLRNFLKRSPASWVQWAKDRFATLVEGLHLHFRKTGTQSLDEQTALAPPVDESDERTLGVVNRYHPTSYAGKLVTIFGKDSWAFGGISASVDPRIAWCNFAEGGSEVRVVPGDHMEILKAPNSSEFAKVLKDCLERPASYRS